MSPADALIHLLAELRHRQEAGATTVALSSEGETALRDLIARAKGVAQPERSESAKSPTSPAQDRPAKVSVKTPAQPLPVPAPASVRVLDELVPTPPKVDLLTSGSKSERLAALRERVLACPECRRHTPAGSLPVFGSGSVDADILWVGEGPDEDELRAGEPLVGPAGDILTKALSAMGLSREQVYLTDVMKWRTVMANGLGDRAPTARELAFCLPYLRAQIAIIQPKVIVTLGNAAVNGMLALEGDATFKVTRQRGQWLSFEGLPVLPTFHPSYLLRNASVTIKRAFWEDLLAVMTRVGLPISERQKGFYAPKS